MESSALKKNKNVYYTLEEQNLPSQHVRQNVQGLQLNGNILLFPHGSYQLRCDLLTHVGSQALT